MDSLLAGRRVLVVEDEMLVLLMIEDMLADLGCEHVSAAATVTKALALVAEQSFDAAMLDMNLNGEETYAVADALTERGVPFAFATGYGSREAHDGYRDRPVLKSRSAAKTCARRWPLFLSAALSLEFDSGEAIAFS